MKNLIAPDVVLDLLGEGHRVADEAGEALPQGIVEALDMVGFPCFLRDGFVALRRDDAVVHVILGRNEEVFGAGAQLALAIFTQMILFAMAGMTIFLVPC